MKYLFLLFPALLLTACGNSLEGKYTCGAMQLPVEFKSNGKVIYWLSEMDYKIEDKTVKLVAPQGTIIFGKISDDGTLNSVAGACRKEK